MLNITALLIGSPFSVGAIEIRACCSQPNFVPVKDCCVFCAHIAPIKKSMFFALAAMDHRLIPKLHRHALKLAAGGAIYGGRFLYQFSGFPRLSFVLPVVFSKQSVSVN
jgi:hypothetical protein